MELIQQKLTQMSTLQSSDFMQAMADIVRVVGVDIRDEWPINPDSYTKSESISRGAFGIVRLAEAKDPSFGLDGLDTRSCVIKTVYLRRRFDAVLRETAEDGQQQAEHDVGADEKHNSKLARLYRRTIMELFVLSRCRHANIMHLHAVFLTGDDMHIVLPRLYVLQQLVKMYKHRKQLEPIPVTIIAKILRQLCLALDHLQRIGIAHRDVQPENIFLTRGGTVKLGHFTQARAVLEDSMDEELRSCKTPVGKEEYMCFEKQYNLHLAANTNANNHPNSTASPPLDYSHPADMWSLGVLVLHMVSYFPDEQCCQKLHKHFAMAMQHERMPFIWLTVDMLQLRSRLVKSGGEELKLFLSDCLLTVSAERRATAASLLRQPEMGKWCGKTVEQDAEHLRRAFINEVDFANQMKLEQDAPNYDALETKDIPADFYWDDTWKKLENMELALQLRFPTTSMKMHSFKFSDPEPFFRLLYTTAMEGHMELTDLLAVDQAIKETIFEFVQQQQKQTAQSGVARTIRRQIPLPSAQRRTNPSANAKPAAVEVEIGMASKAGARRLRLASESP